MNPQTAPTRTLSILVVDDDADTALSLVEVLTMRGFSARAAFCGREAMASAWLDPPDVVILDLVMPQMNGWELAAALNDSAKPPVLIAISGACGEYADERSARAAINFHLTKPASPAELVALLRRVGDTLEAIRGELPAAYGGLSAAGFGRTLQGLAG